MRRILLSVLLLLAACSGPDERGVRSEFQRAKPDAEIVSLSPGEGDDEHVYYHIEYRLPADSAVHQAVWAYRKGQDGAWTRFHADSTDPSTR